MRGDIHGLTYFVHTRDQLVVKCFALNRIVDCCYLIAIAKLDRTFEPHTAELTSWP